MIEDGWTVVIYNFLVGVIFFPIISMTLEELSNRVNSQFLVLSNVLMVLLHQGCSSLTSYFFSFFFNEPSKENNKKYLYTLAGIFGFNVLLFLIGLVLKKRDGLRASVKKRVKIKEILIREGKEKRKQKRLEKKLKKMGEEFGEDEEEKEEEEEKVLGVEVNGSQQVDWN